MRSIRFNQYLSFIKPWFIWSLGALAFFIQYIIRVAPSSTVPELMQTFQASSLEISSFAAYFLYAYVLMQIPVGILVDKYGVRVTLSLATVMGALSALLFSYTNILYVAQIARFLFGISAAFTLVATLKLALIWFPPQLFSILVGFTQSLGMIGGAMGSIIIGRLANQYGWQPSIRYFGCCLIILSLVIAYSIRNGKKLTTPQPKMSSNTELKAIFKNPQNWIIAVCGGLLYMPTAVFAELWGGLYLSVTRDIPATTANDGIALIFLGWAIGGPCVGFLANQLGRRKVIMLASLFSCILMNIILYSPLLSLPLLYVLLFLYGFCNSGLCATYTAIAEINPASVAGLALAFGNSMSVIVGAVCQQLTGALIDWLHTHTPFAKAGPSVAVLQQAMLIVVIGIGFAFILSFFIKETFKDRK